jgi:phage terminase large subunit
VQQIRSGDPPEGLASASSGYIARDPFVDFHEREQRWAVLVCHRRCGKTVACVMDLIDAATRFEGERGRFCYIAPFYVQAKTVA